MADDAEIFTIRTPISFERLNLETSNLVWSNFDGMQKQGQTGCDPAYVT